MESKFTYQSPKAKVMEILSGSVLCYSNPTAEGEDPTSGGVL